MAVKCVGCLAWMLEGKYCLACIEANAGKTPCALARCTNWFWRMNRKQKYCSGACGDIAYRLRREWEKATQAPEPAALEDDLIDNPATDELACATCKYGAPSKHSDSGWECLDACFLSCKPYTDDPLHWIKRGD